MAVTEIRIDYDVPLSGEPDKGHNRWHPFVEPVVRCKPGDDVVLEARDGTDLQLNRDSTADDVAQMDLGAVHPLTGPVYVEGAEPGDLLAVEILDVSTGSFGFTAHIPGVGFLRDEFPDAHLTRWEIGEKWATSPDLPGVRVPGAPFMGIMGVAPSLEMVDRITAREADVVRRGGFALLPEPDGAIPAGGVVARSGLRTIPPRENGGNVDIKQLTAGTTVLLPVFVEGALFSTGDGHFAQGDGEICGTAIEANATLHARFGLRKGKAAGTRQGIRFEQPQRAGHIPGPVYATTGISVDSDGVGHAEDLNHAARNAALSMIDYLEAEHGFTRQQAYTICSVAVDLHVSEVVDVPNFVVTAFLPLAVLVGG